MGPDRRYSIGLRRRGHGLYSQLVFIRRSISSKILMGKLLIVSIFSAAVGVQAAGPNRVNYDIHFTATRGVAPTDGSFIYDSSTQSFSDFEVAWQGVVFDLTSSANSPTVAGSLPCLKGLTGGAATFALLDGNCGTASVKSIWAVTGAAPPEGPNDTISFSYAKGAQPGSSIQIDQSESVKQLSPTENTGNFTIARHLGIFVPTGSMSQPRENDAATLLANGKVLVAGGAGLASAELYNPQTGKFAATGSMRTTRENFTATLLAGGQVLIAGGLSAPTSAASATATPLASAELYDPQTGKFSATGSMTTPRYMHSATLLADGKVLIAGGYADLTPDAVASAELYDPKTGKFSATTGPMTSPRLNHTATLLHNGQVLIAGGEAHNSDTLASAELYDPQAETFSATGSMDTVRAGQTATLLKDGDVLVVGGVGASGNLATAEIYHPKSGSFSDTGSMSTARASDTATLLADGRVLVAGGTNKSRGLASAELYDPETKVFSPTGTLNGPRQGATATLLDSGKVLMAGGFDDDWAGFLATAELFESPGGEAY